MSYSSHEDDGLDPEAEERESPQIEITYGSKRLCKPPLQGGEREDPTTSLSEIVRPKPSLVISYGSWTRTGARLSPHNVMRRKRSCRAECAISVRVTADVH